MQKLEFYKMQASGNDFILLDNLKYKIADTRFKTIAKKYCQRKFGVGADGLLVIERSRKYDFKMRIFNSDGSEAEMCGNGARCVALWASLVNPCRTGLAPWVKMIAFETKAGIIESKVNLEPHTASNKKSLLDGFVTMAGKTYQHKVKSSAEVAIKMINPFNLKLDIPIRIGGRTLKTSFINTGVPHAVVFVQGLGKIDVVSLGSKIRHNKRFAPAGTNVDFVEIIKEGKIAIRTYERGVEEETLACGTGTVASAILSEIRTKGLDMKGMREVDVDVNSNETLKVYFDIDNQKIDNVWFEGKTYLVYKGSF
jgi:diaminopimelate epimerase